MAAETPVLQTDRTDTGRIIESKMVTDMPLTFNRNFQSILDHRPGLDAAAPRALAVLQLAGLAALSRSTDSRGMANNTLIEGLDNNHKTGLLQVIIPAADALETVSVSTSNYDAEFGRSGGAVTNVTLKSGTNELKGSAFFFGNTDDDQRQAIYFSARQGADQVRSTAASRSAARSCATSCSSSATTSARSTTAATSSAPRCPTMAMRNGDFSAVAQRIYDPFTGNVDGTGRVAFANNQIPQERISPIARRLLAFIPEPNTRRRPARPEQLFGGADARKDHRRVRHQGESTR